MTRNFVEILFFICIIALGIILSIFNLPIARTETSTVFTVIETVVAILLLSIFLLFVFAKQPQLANNFKFMAVISILFTAIFLWVGKSYLEAIEDHTCLCNGERVLIGTKLSFASDSVYTCQQLLSQRGCKSQGIWEKQSFEYPEKHIQSFYFYVYPLLVLSLLTISQCVFTLTPFKKILMRLFTKKVGCKRFYETKSRTIDITGLKTGVPQKFDLGVASFKISTKYQDASEKLKTLDLLQYGLCNDINGVSDLKQRDSLLKKIIETKTRMLEIVLELSNASK